MQEFKGKPLAVVISTRGADCDRELEAALCDAPSTATVGKVLDLDELLSCQVSIGTITRCRQYRLKLAIGTQFVSHGADANSSFVRKACI